MNKFGIVALVLIIILSGCTYPANNTSHNPSFASTETNGTWPSGGATFPTDTQTGGEQWWLEGNGVYDASNMIIQQNQYRLDCIDAEKNIMIYSDILASSIMIVPYDPETLVPNKKDAYTLSVGIRSTIKINDSFLYVVETGDETKVKTYALLDGQLINVMTVYDPIGYTPESDSVLLIHTEVGKQKIYRKNLVDQHEDVLLIWNTSDKYSQPIISDIVESENGFAFVGNIFTLDSYQSVLCCGFIDLQGNLLNFNMYNDEQRVIVCSCGILVQDDIRGFDSKYNPDGKYYFYDLETLTIKEMDGQNPKCRIFISNNGKYLVAAYIDVGEFRFWVYDLIQGALLKTIHYKTVDIQVSQYDISLDESKNGFYLLLKSNIKTQLIYFGI